MLLANTSGAEFSLYPLHGVKCVRLETHQYTQLLSLTQYHRHRLHRKMSNVNIIVVLLRFSRRRTNPFSCAHCVYTKTLTDTKAATMKHEVAHKVAEPRRPIGISRVEMSVFEMKWYDVATLLPKTSLALAFAEESA